jgi:23S rRNA (guanosine2251-2'-O)-methyltransferase
LIADSIEDPHNLGAIIRTAEAAGAHGIIIPKRGGVGLTPIVGRTSAGAVEHLPVVRVTNLVATMKELKERGVWIYGADMNGERWERADLKGSVALVVGSEGFGISRLVRENCDVILSLPCWDRSIPSTLPSRLVS